MRAACLAGVFMLLLLAGCAQEPATASPAASATPAPATAVVRRVSSPAAGAVQTLAPQPTPTVADRTSPTVTLTTDEAVAPWDGPVTIRAQAEDAGTLAELAVFWGDQLLAEAEGGAVAFPFIPSALPGLTPGAAITLTARAVDGAGNVAQTTLALHVGLPATPTAPRPTASPSRTATRPLLTPTPVAPSATVTPGPTTSYWVTEITLPTYPFAAHLTATTDPELGGYSLTVLNRGAYAAAQGPAAAKTYRLVVLENRYLRLGILPDLGGRVYECVFKPTGNNELYSNPVIKPTEWGPPSPPYPAGASWWLAAGGIEWGFPVEEHGYEWGTSWGFDHVTQPSGGVMVTVFTRGGPQRPYAVVDIILPPDAAYFVVQPQIVNPQGGDFKFKWWTNAMVAPGAANRPSADLRFILPASEVTVHTTGDPSLPAPGQPMPWPRVDGRDLSRLGEWQAYLGVFQRPAAQGGFVGVYDESVDEGLMRIYPSAVARGVKLFAMGWRDAIDAKIWTDDGSGYVEMHGGLQPTFDDWTQLGPGERIRWSEVWYPVAGIGGVTAANDDGALFVKPGGDALTLSLFPTTAMRGQVAVAAAGRPLLTEDVALDPAHPWRKTLALPGDVPAQGRLTLTVTSPQGQTLFEWDGAANLR